jgi:hypothetical protein
MEGIEVMSTLSGRLRHLATSAILDASTAEALMEAADEIDRLRALVEPAPKVGSVADLPSVKGLPVFRG